MDPVTFNGNIKGTLGRQQIPGKMILKVPSIFDFWWGFFHKYAELGHLLNLRAWFPVLSLDLTPVASLGVPIITLRFEIP